MRAGLMGLSGLRAAEDITRLLKDLPEKTERQLSTLLVAALKKRGPEAVKFFVAALGTAKNDYTKADIVQALTALGERSEQVLRALAQVLETHEGKQPNPYLQVVAITAL
jgi:hypothetical protein